MRRYELDSPSVDAAGRTVVRVLIVYARSATSAVERAKARGFAVDGAARELPSL